MLSFLSPAVVVGDDAGLAPARTAAPLAVGDDTIGLAAVESIVDPAAIGCVGGSLQLSIRVTFIERWLVFCRERSLYLLTKVAVGQDPTALVIRVPTWPGKGGDARES